MVFMHVKAENTGFTAAGSCCCQNFKFEHFSHVWQTTSKTFS